MYIVQRTYLSTIVHPRTEFEVACLIIERKVFNVDGTRRPELGGGRPKNVPLVVQGRQTTEVRLGIVISTEIRKEKIRYRVNIQKSAT